jgi:hypothetical protein
MPQATRNSQQTYCIPKRRLGQAILLHRSQTHFTPVNDRNTPSPLSPPESDEADEIDVKELCFSFLKDAPEPGTVPRRTTKSVPVRHDVKRNGCDDLAFDDDLEAKDPSPRRGRPRSDASEDIGGVLKVAPDGDGGGEKKLDLDHDLDWRSEHGRARDPENSAEDTREDTREDNDTLDAMSSPSANIYAVSSYFGEEGPASRSSGDALDWENYPCDEEKNDEWNREANPSFFVSFTQAFKSSIPFF